MRPGNMVLSKDAKAPTSLHVSAHVTTTLNSSSEQILSHWPGRTEEDNPVQATIQLGIMIMTDSKLKAIHACPLTITNPILAPVGQKRYLL